MSSDRLSPSAKRSLRPALGQTVCLGAVFLVCLTAILSVFLREGQFTAVFNALRDGYVPRSTATAPLDDGRIVSGDEDDGVIPGSGQNCRLERVFVINQDSHQDRWKAIEEAMDDKVDVPIDRWPAVRVRSAADLYQRPTYRSVAANCERQMCEIQETAPLRYHVILSWFLSHISMMKYLLEVGEAGAAYLVLEDTNFIRRNVSLQQVFTKIIKDVGDDQWSAIRLDCKDGLQRHDAAYRTDAYPTAIAERGRLRYGGTHAVLYRFDAIQDLLEHLQREPWTALDRMFWTSHVRTYCVNWNLVEEVLGVPSLRPQPAVAEVPPPPAPSHGGILVKKDAMPMHGGPSLERIFIINLESRSDRWQWAEGMMKKAQIAVPFQRWPAVHVRSETDVGSVPLYRDFAQNCSPRICEMKRWGPKRYLNVLSCMLSHFTVLQRIRDSGRPGAIYLVMEDDWGLRRNVVKLLPYVIAAVRDGDWDAIRLECTDSQTRRRSVFRTQNVSTPRFGGTHAIIYRYESVPRVLQYFEAEPWRAADHMFWTDLIRTYCVNWQIVRQGGGLGTDIPKTMA